MYHHPCLCLFFLIQPTDPNLYTSEKKSSSPIFFFSFSRPTDCLHKARQKSAILKINRPWPYLYYFNFVVHNLHTKYITHLPFYTRAKNNNREERSHRSDEGSTREERKPETDYIRSRYIETRKSAAPTINSDTIYMDIIDDNVSYIQPVQHGYYNVKNNETGELADGYIYAT